ncbi:MAG: hypothetical protein ABII22_01100 [Candidatus Micrarchaeota archaeon]
MVAEQKQKGDSKISVNDSKARQDPENCLTQPEPHPIQKVHKIDETNLRIDNLTPALAFGLLTVAMFGAAYLFSKNNKN